MATDIVGLLMQGLQRDRDRQAMMEESRRRENLQRHSNVLDAITGGAAALGNTFGQYAGQVGQDRRATEAREAAMAEAAREREARSSERALDRGAQSSQFSQQQANIDRRSQEARQFAMETEEGRRGYEEDLRKRLRDEAQQEEEQKVQNMLLDYEQTLGDLPPEDRASEMERVKMVLGPVYQSLQKNEMANQDRLVQERMNAANLDRVETQTEGLKKKMNEPPAPKVSKVAEMQKAFLGAIPKGLREPDLLSLGENLDIKERNKLLSQHNNLMAEAMQQYIMMVEAAESKGFTPAAAHNKAIGILLPQIVISK
jgi:hypothetical protein